MSVLGCLVVVGQWIGVVCFRAVLILLCLVVVTDSVIVVPGTNPQLPYFDAFGYVVAMKLD